MNAHLDESFVLLPPLSVHLVSTRASTDKQALKVDPAALAVLFEDDEIQVLGKQGVECDKDWRRVRDAVFTAECTVAADGVLRGRENRIWVPNYEPLRTAIMQQTHDSHLTGHPGKDTIEGIILRRLFWPKLRDSVRQIIRNCDVCGRTSIWCGAKAGFLRSLPNPERIGSDLKIGFVTDLPQSDGCTNIKVITDRLSKDILL